MITRGHKYFPMTEEWVKEHKQDLDILEAKGWTFDHTGGGCTAMVFLKDGMWVVVTDDDLSVPSSQVCEVHNCACPCHGHVTDEEATCAIGMYADDQGTWGEPLVGEVEYTTWSELISQTAEQWLNTLKGAAGL